MMVSSSEGCVLDDTLSDTMVEGISVKLEMFDFVFVNPLRTFHVTDV